MKYGNLSRALIWDNTLDNNGVGVAPGIVEVKTNIILYLPEWDK